MAGPRTVTEDNNKYSFVSMAISLAGRTFTEINRMGYNDTLNRSFVYGTSPYALGRTRGVYAAGASVGILKENHDILLRFLGNGWAAKSFDIVCSYQEGNRPLVTDQLVQCAFTSGEDSWQYGPDPLYVSCSLSVIMIIRNGIRPY